MDSEDYFVNVKLTRKKHGRPTCTIETDSGNDKDGYDKVVENNWSGTGRRKHLCHVHN